MNKLNARLFDKVYFRGRLTRITGIMQECCYLECVDGPVEWNDIYSYVDNLTLETILSETCKYYNLDISLVKSKSQKRELVQARQVAMYFAKILTRESLSNIGYAIGGRDHATVLHGCKTINNLIDTESTIKRDIELIKISLHG